MSLYQGAKTTVSMGFAYSDDFEVKAVTSRMCAVTTVFCMICRYYYRRRRKGCDYDLVLMSKTMDDLKERFWN